MTLQTVYILLNNPVFNITTVSIIVNINDYRIIVTGYFRTCLTNKSIATKRTKIDYNTGKKISKIKTKAHYYEYF